MYISSAAFGIKCYTCSSNTSMDDCDKNRKETVCDPRYDRCFETEYKLSVEDIKKYGKGCITKAICDSVSSLVKQCKDEGGTCKASCCDVDLCNSGAAPMNSVHDGAVTAHDGAAPMISVLLMMACSLAAFFR